VPAEVAGAATAEQASDREQLLREWNLPPAARLLAAVGRLWPQKNYKHLFWAMCLLKEIRRDAHLLVLGEGPHKSKIMFICWASAATCSAAWRSAKSSSAPVNMKASPTR
jgi:glycosyltransferase involved in cell wall biosynthesis